MKKIYFLLMIAIFTYSSCSTDDDPIEQEKPSIENPIPKDPDSEEPVDTNDVSELYFELGGAFAISESIPSDEDLLAIQVYYSENNKPYSYVLTDDVSTLKLEVEKDTDFHIIATYIKDGKNQVELDGSGRWMRPFNLSGTADLELNKVHYSETAYFDAINEPEIDKENSKNFVYLLVDRYHSIMDFTATKDQSTLTLELERLTFGIDINVDLGSTRNVDRLFFALHLPEGEGVVNHELILKDGIAATTIPFLTLAADSGMTAAMAPNYTETLTISLGTADNPNRFYHGSLEVIPNKILTIQYSAEFENGLHVEWEDPELVDEEGHLTN